MAVINTASPALLFSINSPLPTVSLSPPPAAATNRTSHTSDNIFADAINNPEADLDKDGQVSLLEAFLTASRQASEFYKINGRLVTEHALLDDNGDSFGTQPIGSVTALFQKAKGRARRRRLGRPSVCLVPAPLNVIGLPPNVHAAMLWSALFSSPGEENRDA